MFSLPRLPERRRGVGRFQHGPADGDSSIGLADTRVVDGRGRNRIKTFPKKKLEGEVLVSIVRTPFDPAHESVAGRREGDVLLKFFISAKLFGKGIDEVEMKRFGLPSFPLRRGSLKFTLCD